MLILGAFGVGSVLSQEIINQIIEIADYIYLDDGVGYWRVGPRGADIFVDKTLTGTGFAGIENTDWKAVSKIE